MCGKEHTLNLAKAMCYLVFLSLKNYVFFYLCKLGMVGMIMCENEYTLKIL
jgi:hypothetical protein